MIWSSLAEFADMGGYGLYVWGSYGMTALALGWELMTLLQRRRRAAEDVRAWQRLDEDAA
ncbi:MAG: heme exporter protein CcmD [Burkholderiaceae bacterium]|nr:heme exporter protein CcmD [Burkholderiaceae bacterium]